MEIMSSTLQLNTADGTMETYQAQPKEGGARPV